MSNFDKFLKITIDKQEKLAQKHLLKRLYYDYDPRHHDAFVLMYNKDCENRRLREYMENRGIIKPSKSNTGR